MLTEKVCEPLPQNCLYKTKQNFRRRGRPPATATFIAPDLSPEDSEEARYRRMRDLNNEASRLCRLNRKRKFETFEQELQYEQVCFKIDDIKKYISVVGLLFLLFKLQKYFPIAKTDHIAFLIGFIFLLIA